MVVNDPKPPRPEFVSWVIKEYYLPIIRNKFCHVGVFYVFVFLFTCAILGCQKLELGLDPQVSMITGSDLNNYYSAYMKYVDIGPPAYLVLENVNYTDPSDLSVVNNLQN